MPELPEVETVVNGLKDLLVGHTIAQVKVYQPQLRYPVPVQLPALLSQQQVVSFERRAKYMLLKVETGTVLIHLGMSGSLCWVENDTPQQKHDHVDFIFQNGGRLRYRDPRRFGLVLWHANTEEQPHRLLASLGPEPLTNEFDSDYLFGITRGRRRAIKTFMMDNHIVVGVGNIYANETLFKAKIHPQQTVDQLDYAQCEELVQIIKEVLSLAIKAGGTTLQDFVNGHGAPGYFQQQLFVYGRAGQPCLSCGTTIVNIKLGQRSSFYCPQCQRFSKS